MRQSWSIANLFDHRVVLYRFPADTIDASGDPVQPTPTTVTTPSGLNARPDDLLAARLAESPIGETQAGLMGWFLDKGFTDIHERDVLNVVSGPESPKMYRILAVSKPTDRTGSVHHIEVVTEQFRGALA